MTAAFSILGWKITADQFLDFAPCVAWRDPTAGSRVCPRSLAASVASAQGEAGRVVAAGELDGALGVGAVKAEPVAPFAGLRSTAR